MTPTILSCLNGTAEVAARGSDAFTSKLVWSSISTELNGTEIGCSHLRSICSTDQNLNFTLLVTGCQGNGIRVIAMYQTFFIYCNGLKWLLVAMHYNYIATWLKHWTWPLLSVLIHTAPNPPRNLSRMDAQCKNNMTNVTIEWIVSVWFQYKV